MRSKKKVTTQTRKCDQRSTIFTNFGHKFRKCDLSGPTEFWVSLLVALYTNLTSIIGDFGPCSEFTVYTACS